MDLASGADQPRHREDAPQREHRQRQQPGRGAVQDGVHAHADAAQPDQHEGSGTPTLRAGEPEAVYTVAFDMPDLWGDDAEPGTLFIDLWASYLE